MAGRAFCKGAAASFVLFCVSAGGGRLLPWAFSLFHYRAGLGTLSQPGFVWWVAPLRLAMASERRRSRLLPDEHAPSGSPVPVRPPSARHYRWDRGRKLTAAEVRAAVERAIALSDKR